ncbi:MAG: M16 family metallopeptidase [Limnochordia bacterium]
MYHRTLLPNGVRIISEHIPYVRSISLGLWFEAGSRDELLEERGLAHFIEHMLFKGTERYSARDMAELMDQCGGHLNAFTGKEHTCYFARVLDEDYPIAVDLLHQMLVHSLFDEAEITKEQGVVLEELNMAEDEPDELVHDLVSEALWPDHPLGRNILGAKETVLKFDRRKILDFMARNYTTGRLVIACAGSVDHERLVDEFARRFESLPAGKLEPKTVPEPARGRVLIKERDTEQVYLCVGMPALTRHDLRKPALYLLDSIVGGGVSSLLFQELREERGLVYNTYSYHSSYRDTGLFSIYASFSRQHLDAVLSVILEQLGGIGSRINDEVLERAKGQFVGNLMLSLESMSNRMTNLAKNEINYGRIVPVDELAAAVQRVTKDEIIELAEALFRPSNLSVAAVGPVDHIAWGDLCCRKIC